MEKILGFKTIRLSSNNVESSKSYYEALLGVCPTEEQDGFVSFFVKETHLEIVQADDKSPISTGGSVGYWLVNNLDLYIKKAIQLGGSIHRGPLEVEEDKTKIVQILGPENSVIGFVEMVN